MLIFDPFLLLFSLFGLLFFGVLIYLLIYKPEKGEKILDLLTHIPMSTDSIRGIWVLMIPVLFLVFLCTSCLMIYAFLQSL